MPVHESPLARLERHARNRALEVAVMELRGRTWASLTWNELYRRAIDGAAGMIEAGVNPGQVVVLRVPTGIRQLELELATRVAGAVPLLLPEHLDPHEVSRLLDDIQVRLVVVDDDEADLDVVEEAADLVRVEVLGQQQRHGARDARGELELELADAGRHAKHHDLSRVDPGLDHARGAVDRAAVELVPRQRGPRPAAQLHHRDLERTVACVPLQSGERRFVDRHLRAPPCVEY